MMMIRRFKWVSKYEWAFYHRACYEEEKLSVLLICLLSFHSSLFLSLRLFGKRTNYFLDLSAFAASQHYMSIFSSLLCGHKSWTTAIITRCILHKKIDNFSAIKVFIVELKFMMRKTEVIKLAKYFFYMVEWSLRNILPVGNVKEIEWGNCLELWNFNGKFWI